MSTSRFEVKAGLALSWAVVAGLHGSASADATAFVGVDVVSVEADKWTHPPFDAGIHDGMIWGRGAVDTKNLVASVAEASNTAIPVAAPGEAARPRKLVPSVDSACWLS